MFLYSRSFERVRCEYSTRNLKCLHSFVCILFAVHIEFVHSFPLQITTAFSQTRYFVCRKYFGQHFFFMRCHSGFGNSVFICNSLHKTCCKFVCCAFCSNYHKHNYAAGKIQSNNHGCETWKAGNFSITTNVVVALNAQGIQLVCCLFEGFFLQLWFLGRKKMRICTCSSMLMHII